MSARSLWTAALVVCAATIAVAGPVFVSGFVPDWNQPYFYTPASPNGGPGPDPHPGAPDPWNAWCAPTSAANLIGHWEDARHDPCADGSVFPASTVMWAAGPSWQDFLGDGSGMRPPAGDGLPPYSTDLGYYMDTNTLGLNYGNPAHVGTFLKDLHIGLWRYLQSVEPGRWTTGTQGRGFAAGVQSNGITPAAMHPNAASAFAEITSEINAGRTVLVTWTDWFVMPVNLPPIPGTGDPNDGEAMYTTYFYDFSPTPGGGDPWGNDEEWNYDDSGTNLGHVTTAVGYLAANDPLNPMPGTDWVIVHDNVGGTPRNVAIPLTAATFLRWVANTNANNTQPGVTLQTFGLDDNPAHPISSPIGVIPGFGAEDPFGIPAPGFPPGLAPSPTLGIIPAIDADVLTSGPWTQWATPNGGYISAMSLNTPEAGVWINALFSVDRLSTGQPNTAVNRQAGLNQQPGDIYRSWTLFVWPGQFAGTLSGGPFAGYLNSVAHLVANNGLLIDEMWLGLLAGGVAVPPATPAPAVAPQVALWDNVDTYEMTRMTDPNLPGFVNWSYFTVYPDEALAVGVSAADIFDLPPGAPGGVPVPYAPAVSMGLDPDMDAIDALVVFDRNVPGGPAWGGPGGEPGIDYALFSLAPGSVSLAMYGLDAADVLFTDFSGAFAVYARSNVLGLAGVPGGTVGEGDNIDALEILCAADIDGDNDVDLQDLSMLLAKFGVVVTPDDPADLNHDGIVDLLDLAILLNQFGVRCT